jgi:hypothetical protein
VVQLGGPLEAHCLLLRLDRKKERKDIWCLSYHKGCFSREAKPKPSLEG